MNDFILQLNGAKIIEKSPAPNLHQLSLSTGVSYPTIRSYILHPDALRWIDLAVLTKLLAHGFEMTPDQILDIRLGDIFSIIQTPCPVEPGSAPAGDTGGDHAAAG